MITVRGLYEEGEIKFLEPPPEVARARVAIVFLETGTTVEDVLASYADMERTIDWGEPMDEEGARTLVRLHEELAPYRAEVDQVVAFQPSGARGARW